MSALASWKAKCEGCGRGIRDPSREFVEDAAESHREVCDQLEADEDVIVEEVEL